MDCDNLLPPDFLQNNILCSNCFRYADWRNANTENGHHLNGLVLMQRMLFISVGGYDERIRTYGWEDSDLYNRLIAAGGKSEKLDTKGILHQQHDNSMRNLDSIAQDPHLSIVLNRLSLKHVPKWNSSSAGSKYAISQHVDKERVVIFAQAIQTPEPLHATLGQEVMAKIKLQVVLRTLKIKLRLSRQFLDMFSTSELENIYYTYQRTGRNRLLVVQPMHGLGNRLRALASSMRFANQHNMIILLLWTQDEHCRSNFLSLFYPTNLPIVQVRQLQVFPFCSKIWAKFVCYSYMNSDGPVATKDAPVRYRRGQHLFFRSAYVLNHKSVDWSQLGNDLLQLRPSREVMQLLQPLKQVDLSAMIGVHIRALHPAKEGVKADLRDEYSLKGMALVEKYRNATSNYDKFLAAMEKVASTRGSTGFFVASDSQEAIQFIKSKFDRKTTIKILDGSCSLRSATCEISAVANMLALSDTMYLIGSYWSSFSEVAYLLGRAKGNMQQQMLIGSDV